MPNTPTENQLAKRAAVEINQVYQAYVQNDRFLTALLHASNDDVVHYVKFYDNGAFMTNLRLFDQVPTGCHVSAFTDRGGKPLAITGSIGTVQGNVAHSTVYVNRSAATAGTLIHEYLHAVSSPGWFMFTASKPGINEAVTEYFTRKVLKKSGDAAFSGINRAGIYDNDLAQLLEAKGVGKTQGPGLTTDLKNAYFKGTISNRITEVIGMAGIVRNTVASGGRAGGRRW